MWRRARRILPRRRLDWLEQAYNQPDAARNFGIWTEAPRRPARGLPQAAPHILDQGERRDTVLWPALFAAWPQWHWGMQPTGDCTRWMQQHLLDVLLATLWAAGKIRKPDALVAGESIYGFAKCELANSYGYHGAGSTGYDVAEACVKFGSLYREQYQQNGQACDLHEDGVLDHLGRPRQGRPRLARAVGCPAQGQGPSGDQHADGNGPADSGRLPLPVLRLHVLGHVARPGWHCHSVLQWLACHHRHRRALEQQGRAPGVLDRQHRPRRSLRRACGTGPHARGLCGVWIVGAVGKGCPGHRGRRLPHHDAGGRLADSSTS